MKYTLIVLGLSLNMALSQCDNLSESQCGFNINCEWTEDIVDSGNCSEFNNNFSSCNSIDDCNWTSYQQQCTGGAPSDCPETGCGYSWLEYQCTGSYTVSYCNGGYYEVDNGYCADKAILECSEINSEIQCDQGSECNWVEDINTGYCGQHNTASSCPNYPICSWSCDGCWYLGECCGSYICTGGYYQIDDSYCEETEIIFIPGDSNGDYSLNVTDIVLIVEYILNSQYHQHSDINQDGYLNVTDIVDIVNTILEN